MNDEIFGAIKALIEEKMGKYKRELTRDTCLEADLGIIGDDAVELLIDYSKKFNVDLSKFDIQKYFTPAGDTILPGLIRTITGERNPKQKELTIGDLEQEYWRAGSVKNDQLFLRRVR